MNALDLLDNDPVHALIVGYPGGGKTGAVAALLNAGFKVRMLDFEGNYQPLIRFTDPAMLKNLDILTFQDKMVDNQGKFIEAEGIPTAFNEAIKALKHWRYVGPDGKEVDLGKSSEWGPDTVLLTDSLTAMGEASQRRAMKMMNQTVLRREFKSWGLAVEDQMNLIKIIHNKRNRFHHVMLAHLQMVGPKDVTKEDEEKFGGVNAELKKEVAEIIATRLYPKAVTKNASTFIHKEFSTMLLAEQKYSGGRIKRFLRTEDEHLDLKVPARNVKSEYPIETGLADIFKLLGASPKA